MRDLVQQRPIAEDVRLGKVGESQGCTGGGVHPPPGRWGWWTSFLFKEIFDLNIIASEMWKRLVGQDDPTHRDKKGGLVQVWESPKPYVWWVGIDSPPFLGPKGPRLHCKAGRSTPPGVTLHFMENASFFERSNMHVVMKIHVKMHMYDDTYAHQCACACVFQFIALTISPLRNGSRKPIGRKKKNKTIKIVSTR